MTWLSRKERRGGWDVHRGIFEAILMIWDLLLIAAVLFQFHKTLQISMRCLRTRNADSRDQEF